MRDLVTGDQPNGERLDGRDCDGLAVERRELDFERLAVRIDVSHGTNVADFEAFGR